MKSLILLPFIAACYYWGSGTATSSHTTLVEVCDNAMDDDDDGFVDLNDPDCNCPIAEPLSLIPNPSFEEQSCCPFTRSQLYCATGWRQASEATTDLLHTCGWMGWDDLPPPLPFPDGNGCVGLRNGRVGGGNGVPFPNWKEYAGACLTGPLRAGVSYRFEFFVGFTHAFNSPPTSLVFFGSTDCANLPFGVGNDAFGCPTNGPGWLELGSVPIAGANEWIENEINITPNQDIHAIAIGPNCSEAIPLTNYYYFFDNLVLAAQSEFDFKITAAGHPCSKNISLNIPYRDTLQYQWYKNGVALTGQTQASLNGVGTPGNYQVRILGPYSCKITKGFQYAIPGFSHQIKTTICKEDNYPFSQQRLTASGTYFDTLKTANNCDSIIRLDLEVAGEIADTVFAKIYEGESWMVGHRRFTRPGEYPVLLNTAMGCDSLVHLFLDAYKVYIPNAFSPNGDGINDFFTIHAGSDLEEILLLKVFDRWGGLVFQTQNLQAEDFGKGWDGSRDGKPAIPGVYVYKASVVFNDGKARELSGSVMLVE